MSLLVTFSTAMRDHVPFEITTVAEFLAGVGMVLGSWWNRYSNPKFKLAPWAGRPFSANIGMAGLYIELVAGLFMIADSFDRTPYDLPPIAFTLLAMGLVMIQVRSFFYERTKQQKEIFYD